MKTEFCYLMLLKGGEKYFFKYLPGEEKNLFYSLIEYGKDDAYNITLPEVLSLIKKISSQLRDKGYVKNFTFQIAAEAEAGETLD